PFGVLLGSLGAAFGDRRDLVAPHLAKYADYDSAPFVALNTAFLRDGLFLYLPRGTVLREPLHLVHVGHAEGEPVACYPRTLIVCDSNTQATVVQSYVGTDGTCFANAVTEVVLRENAHLDHYKVQRESKQAFHFETLQVRQERGSNFRSHALTLGGRLVR